MTLRKPLSTIEHCAALDARMAEYASLFHDAR
jgi:hypothetical protein